jgi:AcrR family transcriptional regulator
MLDTSAEVTRIQSLMKSKNTDKRTERTRQRLQSTLHSLLQRRDYAAITVDAICRHGKVGRSTFYTHFRSKDDLKRSALDHLRHELAAAQFAARNGTDDRPFAFSSALFEHARAHLRDYRSLVHGPGGRVVLAKIKDIVAELVRSELLLRHERRTQSRECMDLQVSYITGALMSLLTQWLSEGARTDIELVDAIFSGMSRAAINDRTASEVRASPTVHGIG